MSAVSCGQCGHPHPDVLRRSRRRVRYSCQMCGAVVAAAPFQLAAVTGDPLGAFMPARMVRWVRGTVEDPAAEPDRITLARWYKDFDALTDRARGSAAARAEFERVSEVPLERLAKPPTFAKVCAALHAACYDRERAAAQVGDAERAEHVWRWFATAGRAETWLEGPPALVTREQAERLLADVGEQAARVHAGVFFAVLFGVAKGPSIAGVIEQFGEAAVRDAVRAYLDTGARPLRDAVLARLAAG